VLFEQEHGAKAAAIAERLRESLPESFNVLNADPKKDLSSVVLGILLGPSSPYAACAADSLGASEDVGALFRIAEADPSSFSLEDLPSSERERLACEIDSIIALPSPPLPPDDPLWQGVPLQTEIRGN